MNKKKVVLYIFLTFALLCTSVYATISGDIRLIASKDTIKAGEEATLALTLSYNANATSLPTNDVAISNLGITLVYGQV